MAAHTISVDRETMKALVDAQERYREQHGFKPTWSQLIKHHLHRRA